MHCEAGNGLGIGPLGNDEFDKSVKGVTMNHMQITQVDMIQFSEIIQLHVKP